MSSPEFPLTSSPSDAEAVARTRLALRTITLLGVATAGLVAFSTYLAYRHAAWQLYVVAGLCGAYLIALFCAGWFIGTGRYSLGVHVLLGGLYITFPLAALLLTGVELFYGVCQASMIPLIAHYLLPREKGRLHIATAISAGIATALLTFLGPLGLGWLNDRFEVPEFRTLMPFTVVGACILFFLFFVSRLTVFSFASRALPTPSQGRNSFWAGVLVGIMGFPTFLFTFILFLREPAIQALATSLLNLAITVAGLVCALWARRGRPVLGVMVLLTSFALATPFYGLFLAGAGPLVGFVVFMILIALATQTLPQRYVTLVIIGGIISALASALLGLYVTQWQVDLDVIVNQLVPVIAGVMLVLFTGFLIYQYRSLALANKLIIVFLVVTLVIAGGITYYNQVRSTELIKANITRQLTDLADARALAIGEVLNRQVEALGVLGLNELLQNAVETSNAGYVGDQASILAELQRLDREWQAAVANNDNNDLLVQERLNNMLARSLGEYRASFPDQVEVFVTDRYGALVAATNHTSDYYQADEEWWQAAYRDGQGSTYISTPGVDESSRSYSFIMAVPIRDRETRELVGILRTTYRLESLSKLFDVSSLGEGGDIHVYFPGERVQRIGASQGAVAGQEVDALQWEAVQAALNQGYGELVVENASASEKKAVLAGASLVRTLENDPVIRTLGWVVLVHQDKGVALAPVDEQTRQALLVVLLIIGGVMAVAIFMAQFIAAPIGSLTEVAGRLGAGDLQARAVSESPDEIGALAEAFNTMATQLQQTLLGLEQRVADRTRALQTTTEVSRRLSTILDQQTLVSEVVEQIQKAFGYYHAHIYLLDDAHENLLLAAGTGEAGQTMMARGHKIALGSGLVGRSAVTNMPFLVSDTSEDVHWISNPLLPDTMAEIAVPISLGENVLGVLDVQHNVVNGLSQADVDLLQSIANQVAIALQNARSYTEAQHQAERESLIGLINQRIRETNSVEEALRVAVRELGRAVGAPQTRVQVGVSSRSKQQEG